ncbi:gliding motility-associated C-terminal domain-containing protein [Adhaeribacter aquaticus]|uniref:T9SS type B sorting domain-containing protein n=1 Tax=Adhaeribacter aquaticus TaxID=299567 RepID=UPI0004147738|nr:gliding motility-associated C-terminal domain-containing protein [Adhaeribacter aquaticus]
MPKVFFFVIFFFCQFLSFSQSKRTNIWAFGYNAGLDFNQTTPKPFRSAATEINTTASIADESGNLLFYTDGSKVWNANHEVMKNGTGLDAHDGNFSQQTLIVPKPGSKTQYYIFTISDSFWAHNLLYHEVDFANDPSGEVITKNKKLGDQSLLVKIAGVFHADKNKVWILVQGANRNEIYTYIIDSKGINPQPVISKTLYRSGSLDYGQAKFSPDGKFAAIANGLENQSVWLFDFDNETGKLTNFKLIRSEGNPESLEFSPNSKVLYVASRSGSCKPGLSNLYQYDLSKSYSASSSIPGRYIAQEADNFGMLQLASNGKIYIGGRTENCVENAFLHLIDNPDTYGPLCSFIKNALSLGGQHTWQGLPNFISSYFNKETYLPDYDLQIPNIITLNNDGLNDRFYIKGLESIDSKKEFTLYTRDGKIVYKNPDFQNNWDNKDLKEGIYFYNLFISAGEKRYKGWIEIMK